MDLRINNNTMTVEYIVKRIYKKSRLIHDLDLFAFKKLVSTYPIILISILCFDTLLLLNRYFGIAANIIENTTRNEIIFTNALLAYITFRAWKNSNKVKYEFVEPDRYIADLKEYTSEELRKLVIQINKRRRIMTRMVGAMAEYELIIPGSFLLAGAFKLYDVLAKGNFKLDLVYIFFISVVIALQVGFLLGFRKNPSYFKTLQNTIVYKVRNLIIDSIVSSSINPGSNAIRKPNK